jgi:hypothetical protein
MREQHSDGAGPAGRYPAVERRLEQRPWNRGQDAAAVHGPQRSRRATVREAAQCGETERDDVVAGSPAEVSDESDPARVVPGRRLSTRFRWHVLFMREPKR